MSEIARRLIEADEGSQIVPLFTATDPTFDVEEAYGVLPRVEDHRRGKGWVPVGRKIGFTNHNLWARYNVDRSLWAHVWDRTLVDGSDGDARVDLAPLVQPRVEPEVVFKLSRPIGPTEDAAEVLAHTEWIAPGFEVVQCHYADWKFRAPDGIADYGLHARLVVGPPLAVTRESIATLVAGLPGVEVTLLRNGEPVDKGVGANVLGSPALALAHLAEVLAAPPASPPLAAGEIVTTGTLTDAWPVAASETWTASFRGLGLGDVRVSFQ